MNVAAFVSILLFYLLILIVGIWATRKKKVVSPPARYNENFDIILAGRNLGCFVVASSMTATWVSGIYINGIAEAVYTEGLYTAHVLWGYTISLILGGLVFAKKMRDAKYITMLDPLQEKYGNIMGCILYIPAVVGEMFWSAALLASLGESLHSLLDIHVAYIVIGCMCVVVAYTVYGGLYAVAFTDVVHLFCIVIGLWLTVPFALTHKDVHHLPAKRKEWFGELNGEKAGTWLDISLVLVFGGIPWQGYFQRVLSAKSAHSAQMSSLGAAFGCLVMAIPSVLIGAVAKSTDWLSVVQETNSTLFHEGGKIKDSKYIVPMVMQYLTPQWVSIFGAGAVSAAVMSSLDSSVLSASSMFSYNIYRLVFRQKALSAKELVRVVRLVAIVFASVATCVSLTVHKLNKFWWLATELVYVLLFPQLLCAVYLKFVNMHGSIAALLVGVVLRLCGGEQTLNIPVLIKYPLYDGETGTQLFPFRTFAMGCSLLTLIFVSMVTNSLLKLNGPTRTPEDIDIIRISYKEPEKDNNVTSFSKISRWSGSYNNITASATELRTREDKSLLKSTLNRSNSNRYPIMETE